MAFLGNLQSNSTAVMIDHLQSFLNQTKFALQKNQHIEAVLKSSKPPQ
jgi:hypothetical protein